MAKTPKTKRPASSTYNDEKAGAVCDLVGTGKSTREACRLLDIPEATFRGWAEDHPDLAARYARARDMRMETLLEQSIEIADQADAAAPECGSANVQKARLQIDTRKWFASKLMPKKYGDKLDVEHKGEITQAVRVMQIDGPNPYPPKGAK